MIKVFGVESISFSIENETFTHIQPVHDWRNYVPDSWREKWKEFTERERNIIFLMCEQKANDESWD